MLNNKKYFSLILVLCMLVSLVESGLGVVHAEESDEYIYKSNEDGTHYVYTLVDGEMIIIQEAEECIYGEDGNCMNCGAGVPGEDSGTPEEEYYEYKTNGDGTHNVYLVKNGTTELVEEKKGCEYEKGFCMYCGYGTETGEHEHEYKYTDLGDGSHEAKCEGCGDYYVDRHIYGEDGNCMNCGAGVQGEDSGTPEEEYYKYETNGDGTHNVYLVKNGTTELVEEKKGCEYEKGFCMYCGYGTETGEHEHEYKYTDLGDGSHEAKCEGCGDYYVDGHVYGADGNCMNCGAGVPGEDSGTPEEEYYEYKTNGDGTHNVYLVKNGTTELVAEKKGCEYEKGFCMYCGYGTETGEHEHEYKYTDLGDGNHEAKCEGCGDYYVDIHTHMGDGMCVYCGASKEGETDDEHKHSYIYINMGNGMHETKCEGCDVSYTEAHIYDTNLICICCGTSKEEVPSTSVTYEYESNNDGTHKIYMVADGESELIMEKEKCIYVDGSCMYCKYLEESVEHSHSYMYIDNEDGTHVCICPVCGDEYTEEHKPEEDGICKWCGAESKEEDDDKEEHRHTYMYVDNGDETHQVICESCGDVYTEEHTRNESGTCMYCGAEEEGEDDESGKDEGGSDDGKDDENTEHQHNYIYTDNKNGTHEYTCSDCGYVYTEEHTLNEEGICIWCGGVEHSHDDIYSDNGDGTHLAECPGCGIAYTEKHVLNEESICIYCGAVEKKDEEPEEPPHTHSYTYIDNGDGNHVITCEECGESKIEAHTYNVNEICNLCKAEKQVEEVHTHVLEYIDNEDGTHTISCTDCNYVLAEKHAFNEKGICKVCDADQYGDIQDAEPEITEISNVQKGIKISWDVIEGAEGYYVYRKKGKEKWKKIKVTADTTWTDTKATSNGEKYQYKVCAYRGTAVSEESDEQTMYRLVRKNISTAKNRKGKKLRVKWQTNTKGNGYQIQYATSKNFKGTKKSVVKGSKKKEITLSGLKKGKTYYVRIRSYKKVGKTTYYSDWSVVKTVKINK